MVIYILSGKFLYLLLLYIEHVMMPHEKYFSREIINFYRVHFVLITWIQQFTGKFCTSNRVTSLCAKQLKLIEIIHRLQAPQ